MTYELLDTAKPNYKKGINLRIAIIISVITVAALTNVLLCVFRTDGTHIAFVTINILVDIAALWFVFFFASVVIIPRKKLLSLALRSDNGALLNGNIVGASENTETVNGLSCYSVELDADGIKKIFIVKNGGIPHDLSGVVRFTVVDNIAVIAETENG